VKRPPTPWTKHCGTGSEVLDVANFSPGLRINQIDQQIFLADLIEARPLWNVPSNQERLHQTGCIIQLAASDLRESEGVDFVWDFELRDLVLRLDLAHELVRRVIGTRN